MAYQIHSGILLVTRDMAVRYKLSDEAAALDIRHDVLYILAVDRGL